MSEFERMFFQSVSLFSVYLSFTYFILFTFFSSALLTVSYNRTRCIRSIDFAKSSGNIALVPHLDTVNLPDALSMAVTVIRYVLSTFKMFTSLVRC